MKGIIGYLIILLLLKILGFTSLFNIVLWAPIVVGVLFIALFMVCVLINSKGGL